MHWSRHDEYRQQGTIPDQRGEVAADRRTSDPRPVESDDLVLTVSGRHCGNLNLYWVLFAILQRSHGRIAPGSCRSVFKRIARVCETTAGRLARKTGHLGPVTSGINRRSPTMNSSDYEVVKSHIQELRQEAEHRRLVRAISHASHRHVNLRGRMLAWVGGKLIVWGQRLHPHAGPSRSGSSW